MEDSNVWSRDPHRAAASPDMDSYIGCSQTAPVRHPGHAHRNVDIAPEGGCVYPQRQAAMIELDLSGKLRLDASLYPVEDMSGVDRGHEIEGNCNVRSDDDMVYDEMLDFLPIAYNTFFSFEESSTRRPAWASSSSSATVGFDATPLADPLLATTSKPKQERRSRECGAAAKSGSCQVKSEASVRRARAMTSVLKMIQSLDLLEEDEGQDEEEALEEDRSGIEDGAKKVSSVEGLKQVAAKVDAWAANHGQLIGAAYRRGVQSAEMRLKRLSQQLTDCKHRLFEVSRDRQVIATYVRRHEQSWSCRHDRLRMEVLRLQKLIHELQKSPDQPEDNRQMYEGERGGEGGGGGAGNGAGADGGAGTGGAGAAAQRGKTDETMDKLLSVIVEHQSRLNELKLTVFAQQQHILSLEEVLRDQQCTLQQCASSVEEEAEIKQQQQQSVDAFAPDAKSRCSRSTPLTKESQKHDTQEQIADGVATEAVTDPTLTLQSPLSPAATFDNFIASKMSDVLLCDEGDYRLCQTNQPEVATDSTLTNIRCLCHQHGVACSSSAQVQLVGQLPYLMDSPLDTEVAGVLARLKARPFSLADLPYVRHSIAQRLSPEQTPADIDFLF